MLSAHSSVLRVQDVHLAMGFVVHLCAVLAGKQGMSMQSSKEAAMAQRRACGWGRLAGGCR